MSPDRSGEADERADDRSVTARALTVSILSMAVGSSQLKYRKRIAVNSYFRKSGRRSATGVELVRVRQTIIYTHLSVVDVDQPLQEGTGVNVDSVVARRGHVAGAIFIRRQHLPGDHRRERHRSEQGHHRGHPSRQHLALKAWRGFPLPLSSSSARTSTALPPLKTHPGHQCNLCQSLDDGMY